MGGELGNETYIDLFLVSAAPSPPNFTLIENNNFYTNLSSKKLVFLGFLGYLGEMESGEKVVIFHRRFFFRAISGVRVSASNFCSPIRSGSRHTSITLGSFLPGTFYRWPIIFVKNGFRKHAKNRAV